MHRVAFLLPTTLALLAGCATRQGDYPSLAPRPIETMSEAVPDRPTPVATPDASLDSEIASLTKQLGDADTGFTAAAEQTRALVAGARTDGVGSKDWLDAQTALAELDGYRAQSTTALSALDELAIARATKLQPPYPALDAARTRGESQVQGENQAIAALEQQLPGT